MSATLSILAGASILLASHNMAEVERLCDRVSIIREGRCVESGTLTELRHLTRTTVSAELAAQPRFANASADMVEAIVEGIGQFAFGGPLALQQRGRIRAALMRDRRRPCGALLCRRQSRGGGG